MKQHTGGGSFYFLYNEKIKSTEEHSSGKHYHNLFEIYFITEGTCTYFIGNKVYNVEKGDIVLIPEGVIHDTIYKGTLHSRMLINCSRQYIPASVQALFPTLIYLYRNTEIFDEVYDIFKKAEREYYHPDSLSEEIFRTLTYSLFFLLARNKNTYTEAAPENKYIEQAIDYIQNNFSDRITLDFISKMCHVSPEHFSRMFKKSTGFGFNKYLNILRLQKAETLIKQQGSNMLITEIADTCGFEDSNYFSVKFKKTYGISPKKMQLSYS